MVDLTLMLLVAILANTKWHKNAEKGLKPWHKGTNLRVLSESSKMITNSNLTGFKWFSKLFAFLFLEGNLASVLEVLIG